MKTTVIYQIQEDSSILPDLFFFISVIYLDL